MYSYLTKFNLRKEGGQSSNTWRALAANFVYYLYQKVYNKLLLASNLSSNAVTLPYLVMIFIQNDTDHFGTEEYKKIYLTKDEE